ncbi:response regulator [Marinigracilibium pacificum]|uniref:Phosphate regulon transcriptional regulatory protein PhoB n=1 Tax=Marinigracilibium pacificum TaxID=2729599 RepID=A0A848J5C7_9BACT|nr:response regulator transcription factor [Marinigracilibium pacificum]NMM49559.1 response regulator transcription factor [Marinigracilibium pacificum]
MKDKKIKNKKVLIVDDERDIIELLSYNLEKEGFHTKSAKSGKEALTLVENFIPDVILLDIMMPDIDGVETCRRLREMPDLKNTFIIFLTARSEEYSEVAAFDVGADDYITKPIKPRALLSRLNAIFRREDSKEDSSDILTFPGLVIDRTSYKVIRDGEEISLPKKEFELLYFLANNPLKVYNRDELLKNIWGSDVFVLARTVDVHVRKVREKVGQDYIKTIKGVGYKFEQE